MVKILTAVQRENHTLAVRLDNGKSGVFDVRPFLDKGIFSGIESHPVLRTSPGAGQVHFLAE
jgi:hypothetical protein